MQTLSVFEQDIIDTVTELWCDQLRSHVHAGGRHFKQMLEMNFHLCGSSNISILSMQFEAFNGYFINIKR